MISVIIVDDHPLIRSGLRAVLGLAEDITVVDEGNNGKEALELVDKHHPNLLILDVNLPDINGVEVTRKLRNAGDNTPILILSVQDDANTILSLLQSGANGYALKDEAGSTILHAVYSTAKGETWLSPRIAKEVVNRALRVNSENEPENLAGLTQPTLSTRELEILRLLAKGLNNDEIAKTLFLTTRTIQNQVSMIYSKLGVNSRTAAVLYAIRNRLIDI